jgi:hypothetical protein
LLDQQRAAKPAMAIQVALNSLRHHRGNIPAKYLDQVGGWLDAVTRQVPDSKLLMSQRATLEDLRENTDEVVRWYRRYLNRTDINPGERALMSNNLAYVLALQGEGEESQKLVDSAIEVMGPSSDLLDTRAVVQLARREPQKAIETLESALAAGSETASKLVHLAEAHHMAGNQRAARDALARARKLGIDRKDFSKSEWGKYQQLAKELGVDRV